MARRADAQQVPTAQREEVLRGNDGEWSTNSPTDEAEIQFAISDGMRLRVLAGSGWIVVGTTCPNQCANDIAVRVKNADAWRPSEGTPF